MIKFEFEDSCVKDLEACLNMGPIITEDGRRRIDEVLVDRVGKFRIMIQSKEHPPPHFHVDYNMESNCFRIDDGRPMFTNGLNNYFLNINKWYTKNREKLITAWNDSRPTDCPVGKIVNQIQKGEK